jgi:hypothetical protein
MRALKSQADVISQHAIPVACERALKRAVLHRKNALFYRTLHGSEVGDLFMSLIHTCEPGRRVGRASVIRRLHRNGPGVRARSSKPV